MADKREQIIERLFQIVGTIDGIETRERNRIEFDDTQLPAVSVLEGDEEVDDRDVPRTRPSARPYLVTATPQVFLRARTMDYANVGETLNAMRVAIIKLVLEDTELNGLTLNGRGVRYAGQQSTLHAARTMVGAVALVFAITYVLDPNEL